jgi:putative endonuclease
MTRRFYVYMLANRNRTLYVGVTRDIVRRMAQHRVGVGSGFTRRYAVTRLVHVESCERPRDAIAREKEIKRWSRQKKIVLIEASNPRGRTWRRRGLTTLAPLPGRSRFLAALGMTRVIP